MRKIYLLAVLLLGSTLVSRAQQYYMLVGTYTTGSDSKGIYVYKFDGTTGTTALVSTKADFNPSYLALTDGGKKVYVANEDISSAEKGKGAISAYTFDKKKGELTLLNSVSALGQSPCFVATDKKGLDVLAANYGSGSVVLYRTEKNGALQKEKTQFIQHEGKSVHPNQEGPHAHSTFIAPDGKYVFALNLGNDLIYKYNFDPKSNTPLTAGTPATYKVPDGYGPRHLVFSKDGKYAYVLCELIGKIIAYAYNDGNLQQLQILDAAPQVDKNLDNGSAAIRVSPDGQFLYASNRGTANTVAIFHIENDGRLIHVDDKKVGTHPRDFDLTPDGNFLVVASRDDNAVEIYPVDKETGLLKEKKNVLNIPKPVSVIFTKY
ncbi:MAG: lactonase family protein [Chitinophagaceae bacterium]